MADAVSRIDYYKVTVPNLPGEGAKRLGVLKEAGVNLKAFLGFPRGEQAQLDLVPEDAEALKAAASREGWSLEGPKRCFLVAGEDRVGALADSHQKLADAGVNVRASFGVSAGDGRFGALIWVDPAAVDTAGQALGVS